MWPDPCHFSFYSCKDGKELCKYGQNLQNKNHPWLFSFLGLIVNLERGKWLSCLSGGSKPIELPRGLFQTLTSVHISIIKGKVKEHQWRTTWLILSKGNNICFIYAKYSTNSSWPKSHVYNFLFFHQWFQGLNMFYWAGYSQGCLGSFKEALCMACYHHNGPNLVHAC